MRWIACIITLFAGLTMVSNIPFYSFKDINFRRSVPFWALLLVVFAVILISTHPPTVLFRCSSPIPCPVTWCGCGNGGARRNY